MRHSHSLLPFDEEGLEALAQVVDRGMDTLLVCYWVAQFMTDIRPMQITDIRSDEVVAFALPGSEVRKVNPPPYRGRNVYQASRPDIWYGSDPTAFRARVGDDHVTRCFYKAVVDHGTGKVGYVPDRYYADIARLFAIEPNPEDGLPRLHLADLKVDGVLPRGKRRLRVKDVVAIEGELDDTAFRAFHTPIGKVDGELVPALPVGLAPRIMAELEVLILAAQREESPFHGWGDNRQVPIGSPKFLPQTAHRTEFNGLTWDEIIRSSPPVRALAVNTPGTVAERLGTNPFASVIEIQSAVGDICAPPDVSQRELQAALENPSQWPLNGYAPPAVQLVEPPHLNLL